MILCILNIDKHRKGMAITGFIYLFISLICVLFGAVYELYSHNVYSYYMIYAFVFPLAGGVLPFFIIAFTKFCLPLRLSLNLYHSGIASLTVGSIFNGVLEIYGTTNRLVCVYWIIGISFIIAAILAHIIYLIKKGLI